MVSLEWQRCRRFIEAALEASPGFETIDDVERLITEGRYHFWPASRSCVVTEVVEYQRKKALMIRHAGGDLEQLKSMRESVEAFARHLGCHVVVAEGREGWKRVFASDGYRVAFVTFMKVLK